MWPDPSARYRRAEHIQIQTIAAGAQEVWNGQRWVPIPRALELLAHFDHGERAAIVLDRLLARSRSAADGIDLVRSLARLVEAGALVPLDPARAHAPGALVAERERLYHAGMLADPVRVSAFLDAVHAVVRPGDVVIDAGTGTGVLAVAAARAGARSVYAIESGAIASIAERVLADNGVADRVRLVRGDARLVSLPERADVLITETIGANPFDEGILHVVRALRQALAPAARLLPRAIALVVAPLAIPDEVLRAWLPSAEDLRQWRVRHDLDLSALTLPPGPRAAPIPVDHARQWMVADPACVLQVALTEDAADAIEGACEVTLRRSGVINALALGFQADLGAGHRLDSWATTDRSASWDVSAVRLASPVSLPEGTALTLHVRQPSSGDPPHVSVALPGHHGVGR